jgi:hypothetical protein
MKEQAWGKYFLQKGVIFIIWIIKENILKNIFFIHGFFNV